MIIDLAFQVLFFEAPNSSVSFPNEKSQGFYSVPKKDMCQLAILVANSIDSTDASLRGGATSIKKWMIR